MGKPTKIEKRDARHKRLRKRVEGTHERPRLAVFRSLKHIYAQVIDDTKGETLCSASSLEKSISAAANKKGAKTVGLEVGKRALAKGIKKVVFDRGGFDYHGCIASLADGVREAGVEV
jgi:large subunit ribosomal protein L18